LVDLTRISNQPPIALLAATPSGDAGGGPTSLRSASGTGDTTESGLSALPTVKLEGLRGTSQAFDVASSPAHSPDSATALDASAEMGFRPAIVWPMPGLPRAHPDGGGVPATSTLPDASPLPGDGKTTLAPTNPPAAGQPGSSDVSLSEVNAAAQQSEVTLSDADAKNLHSKAHDRVISRVADFLHNLSVAARLNDRRVDAAAVVAVALIAVPFRRFRKRQDTES
jgi:hypothetical protein